MNETLQAGREALAAVETAQAAASDRVHAARCQLNELMIKKPNAGVITEEEIIALIEEQVAVLADLTVQLNAVGA